MTQVAIAFGLTFIAGLATMLGGCVVLSPKLLHKIGDDRVLAASLALAAGVVCAYVRIHSKYNCCYI